MQQTTTNKHHTKDWKISEALFEYWGLCEHAHFRCQVLSNPSHLPLQVDVPLDLPGLGEALLPALQRPRILQVHLPANRNAAFQTPSSPAASRASTGGRGKTIRGCLSRTHVCSFYDCHLLVGASQGDPGDHQQRSLRSPSAGFRQEEADSSQAAHAQNRRGVSKKTQSIKSALKKCSAIEKICSK